MKKIKVDKKIERCPKCQSDKFTIEAHVLVGEGRGHDGPEEGIMKIICAECKHEHSDYYFNNKD